jgi:hypothetical protein
MNDQQERDLNHLLTTLKIAESDSQLARALCHRAFDADLHHRRSGTAIVASAVYTALREAGDPRSLDEVANAADVERTALGRTYKLLVGEFDLDVKLADPHEFVDRFGDQLGVEQAAVTTAHNLVSAASNAELRSGRSPGSAPAGALYLAGLLTGEQIIQEEVAETTGMASVTIRNRYQEQAELLGLDRRAWSPPLVSSFDASTLSTEAVNEQLNGFRIVEMAADLLASDARCTVCERLDEYEHLLRNHYTRWVGTDRGCYETAAELTDLLTGFEALELAENFRNARVRCTHCGEEGRYTQLHDHQSWGADDRPTCTKS